MQEQFLYFSTCCVLRIRDLTVEPRAERRGVFLFFLLLLLPLSLPLLLLRATTAAVTTTTTTTTSTTTTTTTKMWLLLLPALLLHMLVLRVVLLFPTTAAAYTLNRRSSPWKGPSEQPPQASGNSFAPEDRGWVLVKRTLVAIVRKPRYLLYVCVCIYIYTHRISKNTSTNKTHTHTLYGCLNVNSVRKTPRGSSGEVSLQLDIFFERFGIFSSNFGAQLSKDWILGSGPRF